MRFLYSSSGNKELVVILCSVQFVVKEQDKNRRVVNLTERSLRENVSTCRCYVDGVFVFRLLSFYHSGESPASDWAIVRPSVDR